MRFASLPMYNLPEMHATNAAFWGELKHRLVAKGVDVGDVTLDPQRLPVPDGIASNIFFTQICGYPLYKVYRSQGTVLATPCYAFPGCDGPSHSAFFIVRADDPATGPMDMRGRVFGCNSILSNSGMNLPRLTLARLGARTPFFSKVVMTGGHVPSLDRLHAGEIDLCSIDNVTWGFYECLRPEHAARFRVLGQTVSSPALPFVTSSATSPAVKAALKDALFEFCADSASEPLRAALALTGLKSVGDEPYEELAAYESEAAALGYPAIA